MSSWYVMAKISSQSMSTNLSRKETFRDDIRLQEGDVVIVPAYDVLVKIDRKK